MDKIFKFFKKVEKDHYNDLDKNASKGNPCTEAKSRLKMHDLKPTKIYVGENMLYNKCYYECRLCGKTFVSSGYNLLEQEKSVQEAKGDIEKENNQPYGFYFVHELHESGSKYNAIQ